MCHTLGVPSSTKQSPSGTSSVPTSLLVRPAAVLKSGLRSVVDAGLVVVGKTSIPGLGSGSRGATAAGGGGSGGGDALDGRLALERPPRTGPVAVVRRRRRRRVKEGTDLRGLEDDDEDERDEWFEHEEEEALVESATTGAAHTDEDPRQGGVDYQQRTEWDGCERLQQSGLGSAAVPPTPPAATSTVTTNLSVV
jgi:hypothetical protein